MIMGFETHQTIAGFLSMLETKSNRFYQISTVENETKYK